MTRLPKSHDTDVRKGAWGADEDEKLRKYVEIYGTGHWRSVGKKAGLQRCGKSCRLRWTNYLRPDIRHGSFTTDEEVLIIKLHAEHGSRWSLVAAQLPGRTDNDIKNHWNTRLKKKLCDMGIDPVTHQPIADLLRDLAGTMAQSGSAGNQVVEEAARRCFRDNMLNKAVRECGRPPAVLSSFGSRALEQQPGNPTRFEAKCIGYGDPGAGTSVFKKSGREATSAQSLGEYSSSTEESLSGPSSGPLGLHSELNLAHSAGMHHRGPYGSNVPEPSAAREEVGYVPAPALRHRPDAITASTPTGYIHQQFATGPTHSTLRMFPPDSDAFRRDNVPHDQATCHNEINHFRSAQSGLMQPEPAQIHAGEAVSFMQGGPSSGVLSAATFVGSDTIDWNGQLSNMAPIQAAEMHENMGFRSQSMNLSMNLDGVPCLMSNPSAAGHAGPYHDILQVNNVAGAAGQLSNAANLTTSSNMISAFPPGFRSLGDIPRASPTALRLHEYAAI